MRAIAWRLIPIAVLIAAAVAFGLAMSAALARDLDGRYANSPNKAWFDKLESKGGSRCCSDADGTAIKDVDWDTANGKYRVRLNDTWHEVPDEAVVTEPNRDGRTIVWPMFSYEDGSTYIRCFMPGAMT